MIDDRTIVVPEYIPALQAIKFAEPKDVSLIVCMSEKGMISGVVVPAHVNAVISYQGAIYAFSTLAEKMVRLVDLHRLQLISALGYKSPATVKEELDILKELNEFFTQSNNSRDPTRPLVKLEKPKPEGGSKGSDADDA